MDTQGTDLETELTAEVTTAHQGELATERGKVSHADHRSRDGPRQGRHADQDRSPDPEGQGRRRWKAPIGTMDGRWPDYRGHPLEPSLRRHSKSRRRMSIAGPQIDDAERGMIGTMEDASATDADGQRSL